MSELDLLADDLGASARTLRRAAARGAIRVRRPSPNKPEVDGRERRYLRSHWPLMSALTGILRTEKNVRLAVLFGSAARGDDGPGSDIDLLVDLDDYEPRLPLARLELRLEGALDRPVQAIALRHAEASPALLYEAIADGRVLVDREGRWPRLKRRDAALRRRARALEDRENENAWEALEELGARVALGTLEIGDADGCAGNPRILTAAPQAAPRPIVSSEPRLPRTVAVQLRDLRLHRDTLLYAMAEIGEGFPRDRFVAAATSDDPAERAKVLAVERGFEIVMNSVAELSAAGLVAAGCRDPAEATYAAASFRQLRDEGGIGTELCDRLVALQCTRNDLQHDDPIVQAPRLRAGIVELVDAFASFMRAYSRWLRERAVGETGA